MNTYKKINLKIAATVLWLALAVAAQLAPFIGAGPPDQSAPAAPATPPPAELRAWWSDADEARAEAYVRPLAPARLAALLTIIAWLALVYLWLGRLGLTQTGAPGRPPHPIWFDRHAARLLDAAGTRRWWGVLLLLAVLALGIFWLDKFFLCALYRHALAFGTTTMAPDALLAIWLLRFAMMLPTFIGQGLIIYCILNMCPRRWWVAAPLALFLLFSVLPELIPFAARDPVDHLTPLAPGAHRDGVERILRADGQADMPIMVSDAGRRDHTANAYLGGRAAARYVVFTDTFIERFTPAEAGMAIAHELGHYHNEYFFMGLRKTSALAQLLAAFGLAYWWWWRTGGAARLHVVRTLTLVLLAGRLVNLLWTPLDNTISRWDERLADRHALELSGDHEAFAGFIAKGALYNLEPLRAPGWLRHMLSDHPDILERWHAARSACGGRVRGAGFSNNVAKGHRRKFAEFRLWRFDPLCRGHWRYYDMEILLK